MSDIKTSIKAALKRHGKNAAQHFGVSESALAKYKLSGRFPMKIIDQVQSEENQLGISEEPSPDEIYQPDAAEVVAPTAEFMAAQYPPQISQPPAPPHPQPIRQPQVMSVDQRLDGVVRYIQTTVDFYIKQYGARLVILEKTLAQINNARLRAAGMPNMNLARPDDGVPADQVFTTNPQAASAAALGQGPYPQQRIGNAFDTGIAPTKAMVDAQANMTTLEGVPVPNAMVAHPAGYDPSAPAFGFGWNQPRPPRK